MSGALVLGQNQECFAGCFSPEYALHGEMADVRIWNKTLSRVRPPPPLPCIIAYSPMHALPLVSTLALGHVLRRHPSSPRHIGSEHEKQLCSFVSQPAMCAPA